MKVVRLNDGGQIEVGDFILVEGGMVGKRWDKVCRVTPKFAYVRNNEVSETKYRREYNKFSFGPTNRCAWSPLRYSAWRPK